MYLIPIVSNRIVFISYGGKQYSCNPKYIYEYMCQKYGDKFRYVWVVKKDIKPKYVESCLVVEPNTILYYIYILTAKIIINNQVLPSYIPLRRHQVFINTWHGGGAYKKVDSSVGNLDKRLRKIISKQTSIYISSSRKFTEVTSLGKNIPPSKFLECGLPRNDVFFTDYRKIRDTVRKRYSISSNQSLLLYAPTYRGNPANAVFENKLDIKKCISTINDKFNTDTLIFFRAHHALDIHFDNSTMIGVTTYPDMQELLCTCDYLVTDYSSCMWDFSLTGKPGFLFVPDLEQYEKDRSFYTPIDTWPYPYAKTNDELVKLIQNYREIDVRDKISRHLNALRSFEQGNASRTIGDIIADRCFTNK